jgi:ferredoxin-type protein NapH
LKRQHVRKALIFVSFLFFPLTIYYLSPVLIIMGAYEGIITGSFIVFSLLFLGSLFLGRLFCGWICPGGGLQEACFAVNAKQVRGGKGDWLKYLIWMPWLSLIIFLFLQAGGVSRIDPLYHLPGGISVAQPGDYIIYYFFVGLIVTLAFAAGKRAFCHYICWMAPFMIAGTKIKSLRLWPSFHLTANPELCNDCRGCNKVCPMSLDVNFLVKSGIEDFTECILCGSCVDHCPQELLHFSVRRRKK